MSKRPTPSDGRGGEEHLERLVHEMLRKTGKIIPQTPDEVARAEAWIAQNKAVAPEHLRARTGVASPCSASPGVFKFPAPVCEHVSENLARAAREGKPISAEVDQRMKQDRTQAESEADGGR